MNRKFWPVICGIVFGASMALSSTAFGQGCFPCRCSGDACLATVQDTNVDAGDTARLCCARVDSGVIPALEQFSCVTAASGAIVDVSFVLTPTPGQDAEVRCVAVDAALNRSALSTECCFRDFTPPTAPRMVE